MANKKPVRTKGKLQLSRYFQDLQEGDKVAIIEEKSQGKNFPSSLQGRTGEVLSKRGNAYIIKIKDGNKDKQYIVNPIHLKKLKSLKKK